MIKYNVLIRVCDKVESVHRAKRPFGYNKIETIKLCFESLYLSLKGCDYRIVVIGDDLSIETLNFFKKYKNIEVLNENFGSASLSLKKQLDIASEIPKDEWVYLCEDDYFHDIHAFEYLSELINNRYTYLKTSKKKKNLYSILSGDLSMKPLIIHLSDYPDRYLPHWISPSYIFLSKFCHWRQIINTTHTLLLESKTLNKFIKEFYLSSIGPSDSKLSEKVYGKIFFINKALCLSPIKGLSTHFTEDVLTPQVDWEKLSKNTAKGLKDKGLL